MAFTSPLNNISLQLAAPYTMGSGIVVLTSGSGAAIQAELTRQGLPPPISSTAPFRFTLATLIAIKQYSFLNPVLGPIYDATNLTGDTLNGVSNSEGTSDSTFNTGDYLLCLDTAGRFVALQSAVAALQAALSGNTFPVWHSFNFGVGNSAYTGMIATSVFVLHNETLTKAWINAGTGPTGSSLIIDIFRSTDLGVSSTSIWASNPSNRLQIISGAKTGTQVSFDTVNLNAGDLLSCFVYQIGSTIPGMDVVVQLSGLGSNS